MKKQYIILVPGLGDHGNRINLITKHWKKYGVIPNIHEVPWKNTQESLNQKLERLVKRIDTLAKDGEVSLIGMSAGGSLVINAYLQRKDKIKAVINICGRLQKSGIPSLEFAASGFPTFKESVVASEKNLEKLSQSDKNKILTFSPIFDGIVPLSAIPVTGAKNIKVPLILHAIAITGVLIFYKRKIINFITS